MGHRSLRKGFVGFGILSDQTDQRTGQSLQHLAPNTAERRKDYSTITFTITVTITVTITITNTITITITIAIYYYY